MIARAVAVAAACGACSSSPSAPSKTDREALAADACPQVTKPFLYSIEKDGKTSYILGTRHAGLSLAKFPAFVQTRFRSAKTVVVEAIDHLDSSATTATSLAEQLGDSSWDKFRGIVGAERADWADHRGPGAAAASLVLLWEDDNLFLDGEIEREAKTAGKNLVGLDDKKQSQEISDNILGIEPLKQMIRAVGSADDLKAMTATSLRKYCAGEVEPPGYGVVASSTAERNKRWLPKLEELVAAGDVFIAVGSGHVVFGKGLVDMLRNDHYEVRRVRE